MKRVKIILKVMWERLYLILGIVTAIEGIVGLFKNWGDVSIFFILTITAFQQDDICILKRNALKDYAEVLEHQKFNLSVFNALVDYLKKEKSDKSK